jgi:4-hydroxy-3-polyprenylbenzoate decarboxylase
LILVPREMPLSAIHLENMLKLARLGVKIVPTMPAFYSGAQSIQDIIDFVVGKILDQMNVSHVLFPRWVGK